MKTVRLPIFEDGFRNGETLEVDIAYFTTGPGRHFGKIINNRNPAVEKEIVDRIISGLPPRDPTWWDHMSQLRPPSAHFTLEADGTVTQNVKPEDVEFTEEDLHRNDVALVPDTWRPIPGFSQYEMNINKKIVVAKTGKSVSIMKGGRIDNVLLSDDNGNAKRMAIDWLFAQTFAE